MQVGRRIFYDKLTGNIIVDIGERSGNVLNNPEISEQGIDYIDLPYGEYADEFSRVISWHIDPTTKQPVFDELAERQLTLEEQIAELENQLLIAEGVI